MAADWDTSGFRDRPEEDRLTGSGEDRPGWFGGRRRLFIVAGAVSAIIVLAFIWSGGDPETPEVDADPPMIRADEEPIRLPPDDPGGMDIPHRDKLVYQRMPGEGEDARMERLLPPPEEPLPPPQPTPPPDATGEPTTAPEPAIGVEPEVPVGAQDDAAQDDAAQDDAVGQFSPPAGGTVPRPSGAGAPRPLLPPEASPTGPRAVPPASSVPAPPPSDRGATSTPGATALAGPRSAQPQTPMAASDGYMVQLLAVRDADQAKAAWTRLKDGNIDLLGGLAPAYVRADLGARGVIYRLRAGPVGSEAQARGLCTQLARRNIDCMIVRPGG